MGQDPREPKFGATGDQPATDVTQIYVARACLIIFFGTWLPCTGLLLSGRVPVILALPASLLLALIATAVVGAIIRPRRITHILVGAGASILVGLGVPATIPETEFCLRLTPEQGIEALCINIRDAVSVWSLLTGIVLFLLLGAASVYFGRREAESTAWRRPPPDRR